MPRLVDADERRSAFAAASWAVIAVEGLDGATLKRVASEAGCTTGALTHYFPDRSALLIDALQRAHRAAGARMLQAAKDAANPLEGLVSVLREALPLDDNRLREWKVWLAFWGASVGDSGLADENAQRYREWSGLLETLLTPLVPDDARRRREAALLVALVDGLGLRLALLPGSGDALRSAQTDSAAQLVAYLKRFGEHGA